MNSGTVSLGALTLSLMVLGACTPSVPDSGAGVGFGNYTEYAAEQAARDAALEGRAAPTATVSDERLPAPEPIVQSTVPSDPVIAQAGNAIDAAPSNPAPVQVQANNPDISDEQNFDAVAGRESIESDAARLARQREQFEVIEPTAVPRRPGASANIVEYALSTSNAVGQKVHRRSAFATQNKFIRACGQFPSADLAQVAFLEQGGPKRDRMGVDPDGDGFACSWDPAPYRNSVQN